jgi:hypothetical protein
LGEWLGTVGTGLKNTDEVGWEDRKQAMARRPEAGNLKVMMRREMG